MRISKRAQYGLTAMVHLARNHAYRQAGKTKKPISIRQISNIERVPFEFLSKIFSRLEKAKLVAARHGANGGYILVRSPKKITAIDIVGLLESMKAVNCRLCLKSKKCLTKNVWGKVDDAVNKTLKSITLSDLIR